MLTPMNLIRALISKTEPRTGSKTPSYSQKKASGERLRVLEIEIIRLQAAMIEMELTKEALLLLGAWIKEMETAHTRYRQTLGILQLERATIEAETALA